MKPVICFDRVSKKFILRQERSRSFQEAALDFLRRRGDRRHEEFWALRDVSFEVSAGETVGFIGPNGAGKSTALKLISRIFEPTSGHVDVRGRVGALLELGAGFHPDLTGRENIFLNGSILGLSRSQIQHKLDEIVAFSELERFVDVPVKHYSSGMYVRLAFAIAIHIHIDPDVVLIDESLAVGDEAFQHKCMEKIKRMQRQGVTVVLVSHSMGAIADICDRVIWLDEGCVQSSGAPDTVIADYLVASAADEQYRRAAVLLSQRPDGESVQAQWGDGRIVIAGVRLLNRDGRATSVFQPDQPLRIEFDYTVQRAVEEFPTFGFAVRRLDGVWCYGTNTALDQVQLARSLPGQGTVAVDIPTLQLLRGDYTLDLAIHNREGDVAYDYVQGILHFSVQSSKGDKGIFRPRLSWSLSSPAVEVQEERDGSV